MNGLAASFCICLVTLPSVGFAQEEDWSEYYKCVDSYVDDVSRTEPSSLDGNKLIADVLCVEQAADLASDLVRIRPEILEQIQNDYSLAFSSFRYVIERETAERVYAARVGNLQEVGN